MEKTVDSERIRPLIEQGIASIIDATYCEKFDQYLCDNYPWLPVTGYSIDCRKGVGSGHWTKIGRIF